MKSPGMLPGQRLPRDRRCNAAIQLLLSLGADQTPHAHGRSLLTHLVGTARLLLDWNAPVDTVRAGLCHSIYGTNAFRKASLAPAQRVVLQRAIGRHAESLVWSFSTLRRPATLIRALHNNAVWVRQRRGRTLRIGKYALDQLFILECANLLDQGVSQSRAKQLYAQTTRLTDAPAAMLDTMRDHYRQTLLMRCVRLRPTSA